MDTGSFVEIEHNYTSVDSCQRCRAYLPDYATGFFGSSESVPYITNCLDANEQTDKNTNCLSSLNLKSHKPTNFSSLKAQEPPNACFLEIREPPNASALEAQEPPNASFLEAQEPLNASFLEAQEPINASSLEAQEPLNASFLEAQEPLNASSLEAQEPLNASFLETQEPINDSFLEAQEPLNASSLEAQESLNTSFLEAQESLNASSLEAQEPPKARFLQEQYYPNSIFLEEQELPNIISLEAYIPPEVSSYTLQKSQNGCLTKSVFPSMLLKDTNEANAKHETVNPLPVIVCICNHCDAEFQTEEHVRKHVKEKHICSKYNSDCKKKSIQNSLTSVYYPQYPETTVNKKPKDSLNHNLLEDSPKISSLQIQDLLNKSCIEASTVQRKYQESQNVKVHVLEAHESLTEVNDCQNFESLETNDPPNLDSFKAPTLTHKFQGPPNFNFFEDKDYPNEIKEHPDETEEHPNEIKEHLDETKEHPDETKEHSNEAQEHSNETKEHPSETKEHPDETKEHPDETKEHPDETKEHPSETKEHPDETKEHPDETKEHPDETKEHSSETKQHPSETKQHPDETKEHPSETKEHSNKIHKHQDEAMEQNETKEHPNAIPFATVTSKLESLEPQNINDPSNVNFLEAQQPSNINDPSNVNFLEAQQPQNIDDPSNVNFLAAHQPQNIDDPSNVNFLAAQQPSNISNPSNVNFFEAQQPSNINDVSNVNFLEAQKPSNIYFLETQVHPDINDPSNVNFLEALQPSNINDPSNMSNTNFFIEAHQPTNVNFSETHGPPNIDSLTVDCPKMEKKIDNTKPKMLGHTIVYQCNHCNEKFASVKRVKKHYGMKHSSVMSDSKINDAENCQETPPESLDCNKQVSVTGIYTVVIQPVCSDKLSSVAIDKCKNDGRCENADKTGKTVGRRLTVNTVTDEYTHFKINSQAEAKRFVSAKNTASPVLDHRQKINTEKMEHHSSTDTLTHSASAADLVRVKTEPTDPEYEASITNTFGKATVKIEPVDTDVHTCHWEKQGPGYVYSSGGNGDPGEYVFTEVDQTDENGPDHFVDRRNSSAVDLYTEMFDPGDVHVTKLDHNDNADTDVDVETVSDDEADKEFNMDVVFGKRKQEKIHSSTSKDLDAVDMVSGIKRKTLESDDVRKRIGALPAKRLETRTGYFCSACLKHFKMKTCCDSHVVSVHNKDRYSCLVPGCSTKTDSQIKLEIHWREKHKLFELICPFSKEKFDNHEGLLVHMKHCEKDFIRSKGMQTTIQFSRWLQEYKRQYFKYVCKLCNNIHKVRGVYVREDYTKIFLNKKESYRMPKLQPKQAKSLGLLNILFGRKVNYNEAARRVNLVNTLKRKYKERVMKREKTIQKPKCQTQTTHATSLILKSTTVSNKHPILQNKVRIIDVYAGILFSNTAKVCTCFDHQTLKSVFEMKLNIRDAWHHSRCRSMELNVVDIGSRVDEINRKLKLCKWDNRDFTFETLIDSVDMKMGTANMTEDVDMNVDTAKM